MVHSQINHKNVDRLLGCCTEENALMIVMEFICNGNLNSILHGNSSNSWIPFPLEKRLEIAIEVAEVLWCMHSVYSPVLHGDIKPANILLNENLTPKISDFGIARLLCANGPQQTSTVIGSIEVITRKKAVDGTITLAQSFNEALTKGEDVQHMFDEEISVAENKKFLGDIGQLAAKCLRRDIKTRPEMVEVATSLRMIRKAMQIDQETLSQQLTNTVHDTGREYYSDPRDVSSQLFNLKSDVYSLGVVLLELITWKTVRYMYDGRVHVLTTDFIHSYRTEHGAIEIFGKVYDEQGKKDVKGAQPGPLLSWLQRVKIAVSAAKGLEFLHDKADPPIIHNNIKSSDILLFDNDVAKVGDIGASTHEAPNRFDKYYETVWDSRIYASGWEAPECTITGTYSMKSDVYSFGIILLELLTGRKAFD
ncbi:putative wall-associated receptor kinase-like 16 [Miscanthus floridulus]|uniref:putative wall-associated receptor kinase-like 16 n=1 Tax=Miscanthus floridulus TaxID=154761 RepID=UPI00345954F0